MSAALRLIAEEKLNKIRRLCEMGEPLSEEMVEDWRTGGNGDITDAFDEGVEHGERCLAQQIMKIINEGEKE